MQVGFRSEKMSFLKCDIMFSTMKRSALLRIIMTTLVLVSSTQVVNAATLNDLNKQLQQKQQELNANSAAAANKAQEAKSLTAQINNLDSDIKVTEQKIAETGNQIGDVTNAITLLSTSIDQQNEQLTLLKKKLNSSIVEIYRFSNQSDWELVFGADNFGEQSNQAKYVEAVEIQVKSLFVKVTEAKNNLEKQKADQEAKKKQLSDLQNQQQSYVKGAEYQKTQKNQLLGMTVQQKSSYEEKVKQLQSEITHISTDIYNLRRQQRGKETIGGGGSGYPYSSIDEPDAWGFLTRECTSYAAWYLNVIAGIDFVNTRPGSGSAYNWANLARDQGLTVSSSPRKGAAISWGAGPLTSAWGHVAIVEAVNGDGTINISEYNWVRYAYSYRSNVNPSDYGSYSYIY